jgi:hypothetical protein
MITITTDPRDLQRHTGSLSVSEWAWRNIGDSHRRKRKTYAMKAKRQNKRLKGKSVRSDETTEDENSPTNQESNGSRSRTSSDDGNDGADTGSAPASLAKEEVMSDLSLPSRLTNWHTAPMIKTTEIWHRQEFCQGRAMLWLIVLAPLLSELMMSISLAHIHITSRILIVNSLPSGFMSGLIQSFITSIIRTDEALLNRPTSHGRNTRHTFFKPKVLCSCSQRSIM